MLGKKLGEKDKQFLSGLSMLLLSMWFWWVLWLLSNLFSRYVFANFWLHLQNHFEKLTINNLKIHLDRFLMYLTIFHLHLQTNALGNIYVGLWWSVKHELNPWNFTLSTILDWTWFFFSFVCPLLQSIYLTCKDRKKFKTQILNITIRDNKKSN